MCAFYCFISRPQNLNLRSQNQIQGKLLLSRKLLHFRGSRFSQIYTITWILLVSLGGGLLLSTSRPIRAINIYKLRVSFFSVFCVCFFAVFWLPTYQLGHKFQFKITLDILEQCCPISPSQKLPNFSVFSWIQAWNFVELWNSRWNWQCFLTLSCSLTSIRNSLLITFLQDWTDSSSQCPTKLSFFRLRHEQVLYKIHVANYIKVNRKGSATNVRYM